MNSKKIERKVELLQLKLELVRAREDADKANAGYDEQLAAAKSNLRLFQERDSRVQRALSMVQDLQADVTRHSSFEKVPVRVLQEKVSTIKAALIGGVQ